MLSDEAIRAQLDDLEAMKRPNGAVHQQVDEGEIRRTGHGAGKAARAAGPSQDQQRRPADKARPNGGTGTMDGRERTELVPQRINAVVRPCRSRSANTR